MQLPFFYAPSGSDDGIVALHQLISDPSGALYCTPSRRLSMTPFVHRGSVCPLQISVAVSSIPACSSASTAVAADATVSSAVVVSAGGALTAVPASASAVAHSTSAIAADANVSSGFPVAVVSAGGGSAAVSASLMSRQTSFDGYSIKDYVHLEGHRREKFWKAAPTEVKNRVRQDLLSLPEQNKARVQALDKSWVV